MRFAFLLILLLLTLDATGAVTKETTRLKVGSTDVRVNVYHNPASDITFFVPHHNERSAVALAREFVASRGGRLIEIESFDAKGNPSRMVRFFKNGREFTVDPNRLFTENGRSCGLPTEIRDDAAKFAAELLDIVFGSNEAEFRSSGRMIVAVHNNADVDGKASGAKKNDITAIAFSSAAGSSHMFHEQAAGVFLSNAEDDADNFVFLSTPQHLAYFAGFGFNAVVQRPAAALASKQCSIDDGSMSVYSGKNSIEYICLEADAGSGEIRHRQMFESVYDLAARRAAGR